MGGKTPVKEQVTAETPTMTPAFVRQSAAAGGGGDAVVDAQISTAWPTRSTMA